MKTLLIAAALTSLTWLNSIGDEPSKYTEVWPNHGSGTAGWMETSNCILDSKYNTCVKGGFITFFHSNGKLVTKSTVVQSGFQILSGFMSGSNKVPLTFYDNGKTIFSINENGDVICVRKPDLHYTSPGVYKALCQKHKTFYFGELK